MAISPERMAEIQSQAQQIKQSGQLNLATPQLDAPKQEGVQGAIGAAVGFGKGLLTEGFQKAQSGLNVGKALGESAIGEAFGSAILGAVPEQARDIVVGTAQGTQEMLEQSAATPKFLQPKGKAEQTGAVIEDIAEFAVPITGALGATGKAAQAVSKAGVPTKFAPILGRGIEEGITGAAIGLTQGGEADDALKGGLIDLGVTAGLGVLGKGASALSRAVPDGGVTKALTNIPPLAQGSTQRLPGAIQTATGATQRFGQRLGEGISNIVENVSDTAQTASRMAQELPQVRQAVSSGIDERFVRQLTDLTQDNLKSVQRMQDIATSESLKATGKRTKDVIGDVVAEQMKTLRKAAQDIGEKIGKVEKTAKIDPLSGDELFSKMDNLLREQGIILGREGGLVSTGRFSTDEAKLFRSILDEVPLTGSFTAEDIINLKRRIAKTAASKGRQLKLEMADVNRVVGLLEGAINDALPVAYRQLAKEYAEVMNVLSSWLRVLGSAKNTSYTVDDLIEEGGALFGEKAMRVLGNASSSVEGVLDDLVASAKLYGYEGADEITALANWADIIENAYGLTQRGSLQGRALQAGKDVAEGAIATATTGPLGVLGKSLQFVTGQSGKNKQKAIEQLLESLIQTN